MSKEIRVDNFSLRFVLFHFFVKQSVRTEARAFDRILNKVVRNGANRIFISVNTKSA